MKRLIWLLLILVGTGFAQLAPNTPQCTGSMTLGPCSVSVVGVQVNLLSTSLAVGQTTQATAQLLISGGLVNASVTGQCTWASDTPTVATVNSNGVVTAIGSGAANISCTVGPAGTPTQDFTGSASIAVVAPPVITTPTCGTPPCVLPAATQSSPYGFSFQASGGVTPYTWSITVGSAPTGLAFSATGCTNTATQGNCNLTGTPTTAGTSTFTVQVADSATPTPNTKTVQVSLTVNATAACGTGNPILNYCARQDTAVSSGSTVNSGNPPAALLGLTGAGNCVLDDNNSGPAQSYLCRVTDAAMQSNGLTTDNSSSTSNQWADNSAIFTGVNQSNSSAEFFTVADGTPPTVGVKGFVTQDKNGFSTGSNLQWSHNPCTVALCGTSAATAHEWYSSGSNPGTFPTRQVLASYVLDTTNAAWTASTGYSQNLNAAVTATTISDPFTWNGLTAYMTGQDGPQWSRWMAANSGDPTADYLDQQACMSYRYSQDNGSIVVCFNRSTGAYQWIDLRTGKTCGSTGMPCGAVTGFTPVPPPAAPVMTWNTSGGSLSCNINAVWNFAYTYTVVGHDNSGGETSIGTLGSVVSTGGSGNTCSITFTPPTSTPTTGMSAPRPTGYNIYYWCTTQPLQQNCMLHATNPTLVTASTAPAQPTIASVTGCTTGTSSNTVTYWAVIGSASGGSQTSAPVAVTVTSNAKPGCTVTLASAVPTGFTGTVLRDDPSIRVCTIAAGGTSCQDNTQSPLGWTNQTNSLGSVTVTSVAIASVNPPTTNYAGAMVHNFRIGPDGTNVAIELADAYQASQGNAPNAPTQVSWQLGTADLITWMQGSNTCPIMSYASGHWTNAFNGTGGYTISWPGSTGRAEAVITPTSDSCSSMVAGQFFLNAANKGLDTQSGDQHLNHGNASQSAPDTVVFRDAYPLQNPYLLPTVPYDGEITGWEWPVNISTVARTSNVVTVTTAIAHNLQNGANVTLNGVTDTSYNGAATGITVTGSTTFTFAQTGSNSTSSGGSVDRPMQRFCHTWASGISKGGFNSTPRGGGSADGKWFMFVSDMQRNGNGAQGTANVGVGSTTGTATCTNGSAGNCRYDLYVCRLH